MKNTSRFLFASAVLALTTAAMPAAWAGTPPCCSDNTTASIAASPKVRAALDERNALCCAVQQSTAQSTITSQALLAGSPKTQQMRSERPQMNTVQVVPSEVAGYKPTGSDGITASPKVRAMLDERTQTVQIAPLK